MNEVMGFEWDKMYVFPSWTMPEDISEKIGFDYKGTYVKDDTKRIIFTKGNNIIYENEYNVFNLETGIRFVLLNWPEQDLEYTNPVFIVKKKKVREMKGNHYIYNLYPLTR